MTRTPRDLEHFFIPELLRAERNLEPYGFLPQTFRAELISRIAEPALFLPMFIFIIILGWRFRTRSRATNLRYLAPILLPLIFSLFVAIYRACIMLIGVGMALAFGSLLAIGLLIAGTLALFILALIILSGQ